MHHNSWNICQTVNFLIVPTFDQPSTPKNNHPQFFSFVPRLKYAPMYKSLFARRQVQKLSANLPQLTNDCSRFVHNNLSSIKRTADFFFNHNKLK